MEETIEDVRAQLAAMTERAERAERERDEAFDRGRTVGRADVGKYANAIGLIDSTLGRVVAKPLRETVAAVEAVVRELAEARAKLAEVERERDIAKELAEPAVAAALSEAYVRNKMRASCVGWVDHVTGERCESFQDAPLDSIHCANAVASFLRMVSFDALRRDRDEARAKLTAMHRRAQRAESATASARREAIGQWKRADWWRREAKRLGWQSAYEVHEAYLASRDQRHPEPSPERIDRESKPALDDLIEASRSVVMTPDQREAQRRSFAYGNVAIESPGVTRAHVDAAAERIDALPSFRKAFSDLLTRYEITYLSVETIRWDPSARQGWLRGMRVDTKSAAAWVFARAEDVGVFEADGVLLNTI